VPVLLLLLPERLLLGSSVVACATTMSGRFALGMPHTPRKP